MLNDFSEYASWEKKVFFDVFFGQTRYSYIGMIFFWKKSCKIKNNHYISYIHEWFYCFTWNFDDRRNIE